MAEEGEKYASIEETLFQLLQTTGARDMEQGNLLVLLSLVNLMGIINIINYRVGVKQYTETETPGQRPVPAREEGAPGAGTQEKGPPFDPASLLSMLNRFMAPTAGQPQGPAAGEAQGEAGPAKGEGTAVTAAEVAKQPGAGRRQPGT